MKNKLILMLFTFCVFSSLYGYDIKVDGLYYNLYSKISEAELTTGEDKYTGDIAIPETITVDGKTYTVTSIKGSTFYNNRNVYSVSIPNTVRKIGTFAFSGSYIRSISLPSALQVIELGLCMECKYLESINIPDNVECIEGNAFKKCERLSIPLIIPESIDSIGDGAFCYTAISSVKLPSHKVKFGSGVFGNCNNLTSFTIPEWMTTIPSSIVSNCQNIESITIPISVSKIDNSAFFDTGLSSIVIPNTVTNLGTSVFHRCTHLSSATLPNSISYIPYMAFMECNSLSSINIPNSVNSIDLYSFQYCTSLTTVYLSKNLKRIGDRAFANCPNLEKVYCYATDVPTTDEIAFLDSQIEYSTLYVPQESIELYRQTKPWSDFGTICSIEGEGGETKPEEKQCAKPTISFIDGEIIFDCETEGVDFISEITDSDVKLHYVNRIPLSATYNISVYASKEGMLNSEVSNATLCWLSSQAEFNNINQIRTYPALIRSTGNSIEISGIEELNHVEFFSIGGNFLGSSSVENGHTSFETDETIVLIKMGQQTAKISR